MKRHKLKEWLDRAIARLMLARWLIEQPDQDNKVKRLIEEVKS